MAEIFVARLRGMGGFQRHVTLKTIRPERAEDQAFVHMFLDEARLVAALHHTNVAQVHDVGVDDGTYYLALEYIHGESSRAILERARDLKVTIPREISLAIVAGAAAGLHHAHESRSPDGTALGIVHRDVSPSNILVGYDGAVKLIDFGIARAQVARHTETQTGMIKGKFGYMSPEQCQGWPVDRRSDVFGLGIVLYELTTQTRAFRAENDYETMQRIVAGDIARPSRVVPGYPPDLELVVLRALAIDPDARFPTAAALLEAVERCARRVGGLASPVTLGRFLTDLFGARPEPWRLGDDPDLTPLEDIELVDTFDAASARRLHELGALDEVEISEGDKTATRKLQPVSVEADVVTMTSVALPGLPLPPPAVPEAVGEAEDAPTIDARPGSAAALAAAAIDSRSRFATGTRPMPMAGSELGVPGSALTPSTGWDISPQAASLSGPFDSGSQAMTLVPQLEAVLAALRAHWTWLGIGTAVGLIVGIGVGLAMGPSDDARATPAPPRAAAALVDAGVAKPAGKAPLAVPPSPPPAVSPQAPATEAEPAPAPPVDRVMVRITSEPSKATVLLDGVRLGKTPYVGTIPRGAGMGVLKLRRRGHKPVKLEVPLDEDIRAHIELPPLDR